MEPSQSKIVELLSCRRMRCMRRLRSSGDISSAVRMAATNPSTLNGLISIAPSISSADPVKRLRMQHAALVELAGDELLGDEIHSVLQRRHDADVGGAIDAGEKIRVDVLVDQDDRRPVGGSVFGCSSR